MLKYWVEIRTAMLERNLKLLKSNPQAAKEMYGAAKKTLEGRLTYKEMSILKYLEEGFSPRQIAPWVGLTESTVNKYRWRILDKFEEDMDKFIAEKPVVIEPVKEKIYVVNWFKLMTMFREPKFSLYVESLTLSEARELVQKEFDPISRVTSDVFANIYSKILGTKLEFYKGFCNFVPGDTLLYLHYQGPALESTARNLPVGSSVQISYIEIDEVEED